MQKLINKVLTKKLTNIFKNTEYGSIIIQLNNNQELYFKGKSSGFDAKIKFNSITPLINASIKGDIGLAKDYSLKRWETENLLDTINFTIQNQKIFDSLSNGNIFFKLISQLYYYKKRNNFKGSKKNIVAHYDLGNDFYQLWLDQTMTYSSAIYHNDNETLSDAQNNKYQRLINKINMPNATILEIGCGWGGFAKHAIANHHKIKCITLSNQQAKYINDNIINQNLTVAIEDYRIQQQQYDYIVSIEMFEAVGEQYWQTYFNKLKQLLKPNGKILLQMILIDDTLFEQYRKNSDMLRTYIFPGGMLASNQKIEQLLQQNNLKCIDKYYFAKDYSKTLSIWLNNFNNCYDQVKALGYNDEFIKIWQFYLASCSAGFLAERINVVQLEIIHN
jgi:cyclopropane-fatty-acyl-phospholipid synthase